jgi:threonine 3-dehydrogenase
MLALLENGLNIRPVTTHRFPAHQYQDGFKAMLSGASGKIVLDW